MSDEEEKKACPGDVSTCPYCKGKGTVVGRTGDVTCPKCGGTGRAPKIETKG